MDLSKPRSLVCFAGLALGLTVGMVASPAWSQDALGDGRALDANTRVGGTGRNEPTRDYLAEIRFRNAIVTGNAPGGMSFRDEVGYGMSSDFRQRVGSDDLFSFRRDSFVSGLAGAGLRGTEALQYQFALTVGSEPPRNLRGSLLTSRTGGTFTPISPLPVFGGDVADSGLRQASPEEMGDVGPGMALSLRSISAFTADRSMNPAMLRMAADESGATFGVVASPLRGLASDELLGDVETRRERPGLAPDRGAGEGQEAPGTAPASGVDAALRSRLSEEYATRAGEGEAVGPGAAGAEGRVDAFQLRLDELRRMLSEGVPVSEPGVPGGIESPGTAPGTAPGALPGALPGATPLPMDGWKPLVETLKDSSGTIRVPATRSERATSYDLHLSRAREMLVAGRFFEAEQRFTMALAARPGDSIAMVGRIHAQIGAGLDLSASLNLRAFFLEHPEFVGVRYEADMLPGRDRLDIARRRLLEQMDRGEGERVVTRESALLLAYISFLLDEKISLIVGLERLGEGDAGRRDALVPLLRAVWLEDQEGSPEGGPQEGEDEPDGQ